MTEHRLVVDLSSNDLGQTDFAELLAHGVKGAILSPFSRSNPPHEMAGMADECLRAGMPILAWYGLPYFGLPFAEARDLRWCVELSKAYPPLSRTIWADCESDARDVGWDSAPVPTADQRVEALWNLKRDLVEPEGWRFGIYAGTYWWRDHMGNTRAFMDCPWWLPAYAEGGNPLPPIEPDGDGRLTGTVLSFAPKLSGHQYTSLWGQQPPFSAANPCAGRAARDMSYWYEPFEGGEEMADPRIDKLIAALGGEQAIDDWNSRGNSLLLGYGLEQQDQAEIRAAVEAITGHLANHPSENAQAGTKVLPHRHSLGIAISETGPVAGG